jgi:homoserine dehydrogenase
MSRHQNAAGVRPGNRVNIAVIGATGRVGRQLLKLIAAHGAHLRVVALTDSRRAAIAPEGLCGAAIEAHLGAGEALSGAALAEALLSLPRPLVVVDCTASAEIAERYPRWLAAGLDIVTPNKLGPSAQRPLLREIERAAAIGGTSVRDAATVGAQLPLLATLRELRQAGDRIERFEAVLSGTLSYVLGCVQQGGALSTAVRDAIAHGYAEPHPARDLSGEDAARKLVILLRAIGVDVELSDIERVPLVEADLLALPEPAQLLSGLGTVDAQWRARVAVAQARRERWIYRATFEAGHARVAPERVALEHPLAQLAPCENALILRSGYYRAAPLTIAGPGAGVELTAAAVFGDLLAATRLRRSCYDTAADARLDAVAA